MSRAELTEEGGQRYLMMLDYLGPDMLEAREALDVSVR